MPVDVTGKFNTGIAFANPAATVTQLELRLIDSAGEPVGTASLPLAARGHSASFVTQLFPGTSNFRGTVAVHSPTPVAALTLREHQDPLCYTTLPVAKGSVSSGN